MSSVSSILQFFFFRSDNKDTREDVNENQQSTYSHCKCYSLFLNVFICFRLTLCELRAAQTVSSCLFSSAEPVGGWFVPGSGSLCPPASPHSQFGGPISLSPSHGCERYSTLRNHRSAPYTSPYAHRTNSPSECPPPPYPHASRSYNTSSPAINRKLKQMLLSGECLAFLWLLCEWSHRAVNGGALDEECMGKIVTPLTVILISEGQVLDHTEKTAGLVVHHLISDKCVQTLVTCVPSKPQCLSLCCSRLLR